MTVGEDGPVRDRHADYYLALAEAAEPGLLGAGQLAWLDRLEREHDNLRAALDWLRAQGDAEGAARLAASLGRFWFISGHLAEGRRWLEPVLSYGDALSLTTRARALVAGSLLTHQQRRGQGGPIAGVASQAPALVGQGGGLGVVALLVS